jgi:hypothetical protein
MAIPADARHPLSFFAEDTASVELSQTICSRYGVSLSLNAWIFFPGIQAEVMYQGQRLDQSRQGEKAYSLMFKLSTNFSMAGGRLFPASTESLRRNQDAIAGRIQVQNSPAASTIYDLENITILVGPDRRVRTDRSGNFFCGNLQEGVYTIELDLENVPFELVPQRTRLTARVAADAVTRVDL